MTNRNNSLPDFSQNPIPQARSHGTKETTRQVFQKKSEDEVRRLRKEKVYFSFQFLDTKHEAFNCGGVTNGWFMHLFNNLNAISELSMTEFESQRQHYDIHAHDFNKTAHDYKEAIHPKTLSQISPENMIQFRLSSSGGRVHGIKYHNKIYVVWLDPHHNMNPDERYGGAKYFDAPLTPYQELEMELKGIKEEHKTLRELLKAEGLDNLLSENT
ncbi:hypothetical protein [Halobacillus mangrovi]|uniref:hypothetical protein n=1 Tax=Halobacillus mangrovi TaxID=402384 RepID=UPI003D959B81